MKLVLASAALLFASTQAFAGKPCDELKTEIEAKLKANQVTDYSLEAVETDKVGDGKVIGSCEGGTKKIVYTRGTGEAKPSADAAKPQAATTPEPAKPMVAKAASAPVKAASAMMMPASMPAKPASAPAKSK